MSNLCPTTLGTENLLDNWIMMVVPNLLGFSANKQRLIDYDYYLYRERLDRLDQARPSLELL